MPEESPEAVRHWAGVSWQEAAGEPVSEVQAMALPLSSFQEAPLSGEAKLPVSLIRIVMFEKSL